MGPEQQWRPEGRAARQTLADSVSLSLLPSLRGTTGQTCVSVCTLHILFKRVGLCDRQG